MTDNSVLRRIDDRGELRSGLLVDLALRNVDKRDDGAVYDIVQVAIGADLHEIARAAAGHHHLTLARDQVTQNLLHVLLEPIAAKIGHDVADRPPLIAFTHIEDIEQPRGKAPNV